MDVTTALESNIDYTALATRITAYKGQAAYDCMVNAPFDNKVDMAFLFMGFICLYLVEPDGDHVQLQSVSKTEQYRLSIEGITFEPADYRLSLTSDTTNIIVKAITTGQPVAIEDWAYLSRKDTPVEVAQLNQANSGIAYSVVVPLPGEIQGCLMFNYYQYGDQVSHEQQDFMTRYSDLVSQQLALA